jgi:hypothetical protein
MTISTEFNYVLINNETRVLSLDYEIVNENFICMMKTDLDCTILFFGWKLVLIVHPNSIDQLKEWLDLI